MAEVGKSYIVRAAGSPARVGKVWKVYPYKLRQLLDALDDARLRSHGHGPQVLVVASGRQRKVIRRFEDGREVPLVT
jgi:hypothetical protein